MRAIEDASGRMTRLAAAVARRRRLLLTSLVTVLVLAILAAGGGVLYLLTLPGVGDAEARVEALLAHEGGRVLALPPPARLGAAVVSTEDENFYANPAFDVAAGTGRAALAALGTSEDPGGSTIAQQLAKRLYPHGGGVWGTLEEIGLGVKLSLAYSHEQILGMYLNSVYYGNGYWGDRAAAEGYFGVSPRRLTWGEAAMLAGLPQAPSAYDPEVHLALARTRQRHVLDQLVVNGHLTSAAADRAFDETLPLR
ncbi:MAG TPA: biosynthetic peptidoglycan transglycosylase [Solirubrobacterales bacterium]|nr:biosynthetic peptidoglycan transglycosylase [Solirubrobacterales bacterium]